MVIPSVSVGCVDGHAKCTLLPYKGKYSTLSVENKVQCSTLWKIEHTFSFELEWYHTFKKRESRTFNKTIQTCGINCSAFLSVFQCVTGLIKMLTKEV